MALVIQNPPVPPTFENMRATWWNGRGPYTIAAGQRRVFPLDITGGILHSPPVSGVGVVRNELTFSFDLVSGTVSAVVGVSNPSEFNVPMRPYVGVCYPNSTIDLHAGQRVHLIRVDIINHGEMPADIRDWVMNPGNVSGFFGRRRFPSLAPNVTNRGNGNAVIQNVQIQAHAHVL